MRLAIIETDEKVRVLIELAEDEFLRRIQESFDKSGNIELAFKEVSQYLKSLTVKL